MFGTNHFRLFDSKDSEEWYWNDGDSNGIDVVDLKISADGEYIAANIYYDNSSGDDSGSKNYLFSRSSSTPIWKESADSD